MTIPVKLDGITVEIESVYGTDPTPTLADNAVRIADRLWPALRIEHAFPNDRAASASGNLGEPAPATPMGAIVSLSIPIEMKGAGAAYANDSLPEMDPLLRSCGLARTDNFGTDISYAPVSSGGESCTIYAYANGNVHKIVGCRGTLRWIITPGETNVVQFDMMGKLKEVPSVSALSAFTYNAALPPSAVNMAFAIGGLAAANAVVQSAEFDLGAVVQRMDSGNATDGVEKFQISAFVPRVRMTIETVALATYDPYTIFTARTSTAIDWTVGSAQYNRADLDVNSGWQIGNPEPAVFNDFCAWALEYGCGMADVSIKFD